MHCDVIKVFIGYDHVESVAWHTMAASIYRHSSRPVAIVPINVPNLKGIFWESTAVNELRSQAENLANYIVLN